MPPIPLTLYIPPVTGGRIYRSEDRRFYAHYNPHEKVWKCFDMTKQLAEGEYGGDHVLVKAKTRVALERKLGELLPTLPKPAMVRFLRADGTVGMEKPVYPFDRAYGANEQCVELCGLKPVFKQGGVADVGQSYALSDMLAPGSTVYLVWTMRVGRTGKPEKGLMAGKELWRLFEGKELWHGYFGRTAEEALESARECSMPEEKLATPPAYA